MHYPRVRGPQALAVELATVEVVLLTEEETEDETDDVDVTSEVVPLVMIVVVVVELGKKSVELTVLEVMFENVVVVVVIGLMVVVIGVDEGPPVHLQTVVVTVMTLTHPLG